MQSTIVGGVVALVASAAVLSPVATADNTAMLGGGAGIEIDGNSCTLTAIGHDTTGELVGFTAAHCGGPGAQVVADGGPRGTVAAADDGLDYSVIKFDPAKVFPVGNVLGFAINGIGPDPGGFGSPVCMQGAATGNGCGSIKLAASSPSTVTASLPAWQPGDDGAPITADNQLVGLSRKGLTFHDFYNPRFITHVTFTLFSAILNDVNAKGGPGAGFTPI